MHVCLSVDPELVEKVELLVSKVGRRRHHQAQREVYKLQREREREREREIPLTYSVTPSLTHSPMT